jgi:hypothetical protein
MYGLNLERRILNKILYEVAVIKTKNQTPWP